MTPATESAPDPGPSLDRRLGTRIGVIQMGVEKFYSFGIEQSR